MLVIIYSITYLFFISYLFTHILALYKRSISCIYWTLEMCMLLSASRTHFNLDLVYTLFALSDFKYIFLVLM